MEVIEYDAEQHPAVASLRAKPTPLPVTVVRPMPKGAPLKPPVPPAQLKKYGALTMPDWDIVVAGDVIGDVGGGAVVDAAIASGAVRGASGYGSGDDRRVGGRTDQQQQQ